jgi:DNA repair protein RecO (recombination protein O)
MKSVEKEEAIVLKITEYSEADLIVGFLTRSHGRISAFASGARKSQKRFGGALDFFSVLFLNLKSPRGNSDLWRLLSVEPVELHHGLRTSLPHFATASYLAECLWNLAGDGASDSKLYEWWRKVLGDFSAHEPIDKPYELELLRHCGFSPSLQKCVECGKTIDGARILFSFERGGGLCGNCSSIGEGRWVDLTRAADVRTLMESFITYTLGFEPRSLHFKNEVLG